MDKELPKSELPKPLGKMHIRVSKSHLPGNESYKGSVVWQRTLDIEDIARRVVEKRSEYRPETLVTTFNLLKREIYDAIEEGFNVDFGFGRTEITLNGSFESLYEKFDPERHTLAPRLRPSPELKPINWTTTPSPVPLTSASASSLARPTATSLTTSFRQVSTTSSPSMATG